MVNAEDLKAIENFRNYLRIKTVHPDLEYAECVNFLIEMANELELEHQVLEVKGNIQKLIKDLSSNPESR